MASPQTFLPEQIDLRLTELNSYVRSLAVRKGMGIFCLVFCGLLAVGFLLDYFWELGISFRVGLLLVLVASSVVVGVRFILLSFLKNHEPEVLASIVEQAHPELKDRLSSTIELNNPNVPEAHRGSALMRAELASETEALVTDIDFSETVSAERPLRWAAAGAVAIVLILTPFLFSPSSYGLLWSRFFLPWANYDSAGNLYFHIEAGDRFVARGSDVEIKAEPRFRSSAEQPPASIWLNWTDDSGESDSRKMDYDSDAKSYIASLPHVFNSFHFNVSSERTRSKEYDVEVVDPATISGLNLEIQPPAYTGMPASTIDGVLGQTKVFEHSRLTFELSTDIPIEQANLVWLGIPGEPTTGKKNQSTSNQWPFKISEDGTTATLQLEAIQQGPFAINIIDHHELQTEDESARELLILRDQPPIIELGGTDLPESARPTDYFPVPVTAFDDFGIGALELHYQIGKDRNNEMALLPAQLGSPEINHNFRFDFSRLKVQHGDIVIYRVRTADERPEPGPQEVWSEPRVIRIDKEAPPPGTAEVAERQKQIKQKLQKLQTDIKENREQVAAVQKQAQQAKQKKTKLEEPEKLTELAQEEQQLANQVEELAAQFEEHPLYQGLTPDTQEVARENLAKSNDNLRQSSEKSPEAQEKLLKDSVDQLNQSEQKLAKIEKRFDKLAEIEKDLLNLTRLARDTQRLAEDVDDFEYQKNDKPLGESPEQKDSREQKLAEDRGELQQRQGDLLKEVDDLIDRRPELIEAAKKYQLDKLAELAEQARKLAKPQEMLADSLKQDSTNPKPTEDNKNNDNRPPSLDLNQVAKAQKELEQQAAKLALEVAREVGPKSKPAQKALESAKLTAETKDPTMAGQLDKAQEKASQASEASKEASQELAKAESDDKPTLARLAHDAAQLSEKQQQLADALKQLANNPERKREAQKRGQQNLNASTNELTNELLKTAEKLTGEPLKLDETSQLAQRATESTEMAEQAQQQATEQIANDEKQQASQNAKQAADHLMKAAQQADLAAGKVKPKDSPIPKDTAAQVTDAKQQLQQAQQQLAQNDAPKNQQQGKQGQQSKGDPNQKGEQKGQQGKGEKGDSQQANAEGKQSDADDSGEGSEKQKSLSSKASQSLKEAAKSLAQAAENMQPRKMNNQNRMKNGNNKASFQFSESAQGEGVNGTGAQVEVDLTQLNSELQRLSRREWGQLPGQLRTEILQGSRQKNNGDYARLIKLYFQEIAKTQRMQNE